MDVDGPSWVALWYMSDPLPQGEEVTHKDKALLWIAECITKSIFKHYHDYKRFEQWNHKEYYLLHLKSSNISVLEFQATR